jgi:ribosomal protein S18 acetylase RimI-like enzyme
LEARIQAYLRFEAARWRERERIGPFTATFNLEDSNPYLNYAIPDDGAEPSAAEVAALVEAYERRKRRPRLEYFTSAAPAVEAALLEAAFSVEGLLPLMRLGDRGPRLIEPPADIELTAPASDVDFQAVAAAQAEAYGAPVPPPRRDVDGLVRGVAAGAIVVLARTVAGGEPAGGGLCTSPHEGASELAAVGVRPAYRRRGIAAAMTSWLARAAVAAGIDGLFLTAAGETEARIYARAGFVTRSGILHISKL